MARFWWRTLFRLSRRRGIDGYTVAISPTEEATRATLESKCAQALELLHTQAPREFGRLLAYTDGAIVIGAWGPLGEWLRAARLVRLNDAYAAKPETHPAHVASTLVHEATHAWLESRGFEYAPSQRRRIEAICHRAEAAFARRLDGGGALAQYYEMLAHQVLEQTDEQWSDAAFDKRHLTEMRDAGLPAWFLRLLTRIKRPAT